eukprot:scaffold16424_cov107-Isochrysis_galbana.AAC.8
MRWACASLRQRGISAPESTTASRCRGEPATPNARSSCEARWARSVSAADPEMDSAQARPTAKDRSGRSVSEDALIDKSGRAARCRPAGASALPSISGCGRASGSCPVGSPPSVSCSSASAAALPPPPAPWARASASTMRAQMRLERGPASFSPATAFGAGSVWRSACSSGGTCTHTLANRMRSIPSAYCEAMARPEGGSTPAPASLANASASRTSCCEVGACGQASSAWHRRSSCEVDSRQPADMTEPIPDAGTAEAPPAAPPASPPAAAGREAPKGPPPVSSAAAVPPAGSSAGSQPASCSARSSSSPAPRTAVDPWDTQRRSGGQTGPRCGGGGGVGGGAERPRGVGLVSPRTAQAQAPSSAADGPQP